MCSRPGQETGQSQGGPGCGRLRAGGDGLPGELPGPGRDGPVCRWWGTTRPGSSHRSATTRELSLQKAVTQWGDYVPPHQMWLGTTLEDSSTLQGVRANTAPAAELWSGGRGASRGRRPGSWKQGHEPCAPTDRPTDQGSTRDKNAGCTSSRPTT